jgi:hypothetical protein
MMTLQLPHANNIAVTYEGVSRRKTMYAVVGILSVVLAVLGFTILLLIARRPTPPAWTRYTMTHEIVAVGTVALVSFGIACLIQAIDLIEKQPPTTMQIIFVVSTLVVFVLVWRQLKVRATLAEYARQSKVERRPASVQSIAGPTSGSETTTPEDPSSPTRPRSPHVPKKAA